MCRKILTLVCAESSIDNPSVMMAIHGNSGPEALFHFKLCNREVATTLPTESVAAGCGLALPMPKQDGSYTCEHDGSPPQIWPCSIHEAQQSHPTTVIEVAKAQHCRRHGCHPLRVVLHHAAHPVLHL